MNSLCIPVRYVILRSKLEPEASFWIPGYLPGKNFFVDSWSITRDAEKSYFEHGDLFDSYVHQVMTLSLEVSSLVVYRNPDDTTIYNWTEISLSLGNKGSTGKSFNCWSDIDCLSSS